MNTSTTPTQLNSATGSSSTTSLKRTFADTLRHDRSTNVNGASGTSNKPAKKRYSFRLPTNTSTGTVNITGSPSRAVLSQDHAIVLNSADYPDYTNADFFNAIKSVVPPNQIHSFTRTHGTFVVFFLDRSWARQLILSGLTMDDCRMLDCLPLGIPPVRVVVSEVPSHFDNTHLREIMSDFGTVVGPIKTMRSSHLDPDMPHLLSFRRQVMMKFPTNTTDLLPDRIFVEINGIANTFFLSTDVRCHSCGQSGHFRDDCPATTCKTTTDRVTAETPVTSDRVRNDRVQSDPVLNEHVLNDRVLPDHELPDHVKADQAKSTLVKPTTLAPSKTKHATTFPVQKEFAFPTITSFTPDPTLPHAIRDRSVLDLVHKLRNPAPAPPFSSPSSSTVLVDLASTVPKRGADSSSTVDLFVKRKNLNCTGDHNSSSRMSDVSDVSSIMSDDDISDTASTTNPISDSELDSFFDRIHRSPIPILDHVRQFTNDPAALVRFLHRLRLDKVAFMRSPLAAKMSPGAVYQVERKIRKAMKALPV